MLSDTHPDAERVQIELLRQMTGVQRLRKALDLTAVLVNSSRRNIAALNPGLNPQELDVKCVELYYGKELADQLRNYLRQKAEHDHVAV